MGMTLMDQVRGQQTLSGKDQMGSVLGFGDDKFSAQPFSSATVG